MQKDVVVLQTATPRTAVITSVILGDVAVKGSVALARK